MLVLKHGKPMIFGKDRDKGIRLTGLHPEVVTIGQDGVTEADLLVHDEHADGSVPRAHPVAHVLAGLPGPGRASCARVQRPTHDALIQGQLTAAVAKPGRATSPGPCLAARPGRSNRREPRERAGMICPSLRVRQPDRRRGLRQLWRGPGRSRHAAAGHHASRASSSASISTRCARRAPIVAERDTPVAEAIDRMHDAEADCVLVLDGERLVGIFTDRDAVLKVAGRSLDGIAVGEVMTHDPVVLRHDDPIAVAIHKMAVGGFRHIPIVDGGRPTGVVSARDVFAHVARTLG